MSNFAEPGFWIILAIPTLGLLQLLGAALARPHYRRLNEIADAVLADPQSNDIDRAWLRSQLSDATVRWPIWLMGLAAPLIGIAAIASAIEIVRSRDTGPMNWDDFDRLAAKADGVNDPDGGRYWTSPLRAETRDVVFNAQVLTSPMLSAWIGIWLVPATLLLIAGGAATVAASELRLIVEEWALKARSSTLRT